MAGIEASASCFLVYSAERQPRADHQRHSRLFRDSLTRYASWFMFRAEGPDIVHSTRCYWTANHDTMINYTLQRQLGRVSPSQARTCVLNTVPVCLVRGAWCPSSRVTGSPPAGKEAWEGPEAGNLAGLPALPARPAWGKRRVGGCWPALGLDRARQTLAW